MQVPPGIEWLRIHQGGNLPGASSVLHQGYPDCRYISATFSHAAWRTLPTGTRPYPQSRKTHLQCPPPA